MRVLKKLSRVRYVRNAFIREMQCWGAGVLAYLKKSIVEEIQWQGTWATARRVSGRERNDANGVPKELRIPS